MMQLYRFEAKEDIINSLPPATDKAVLAYKSKNLNIISLKDIFFTWNQNIVY
jgi:hypothetical protein